MSSTLQNLIVVVGLLVIAALGYYLYVQNRDGVLSTSSEQLNTQVALESADFLRRLNELKEIDLSGDRLFSDHRFQSLISGRVPIEPEEIGREIPFLEIGFDD